MIQMNVMFRSPRLKVKRSRDHIRELGAMLDEYVARKPYSLDVKETKDGCDYNIISTEEMPLDVPLIIGDAIHNMRSALDILACDLVEMNGGNTKNVYFPFSYDANGLEEEIRRKNFKKAGADAENLLKTKIKPYASGNPLLRALHDLDIEDKHRLVIPVMKMSRVSELTMMDEGSQIIEMKNVVFHGFTDALIRYSGGNLNIISKGEIDPVVVFRVDQPIIGGNPVMKVLGDFARITEEVIEAFEELKRA
jgi:hypothetical protein